MSTIGTMGLVEGEGVPRSDSGLGAGAGSGPGPSRRLAHILSEQKRREKINGGFEELKRVVPDCAHNPDSKATILRKAVDYILQLEEEIRKYAAAYPDPGFERSEQHHLHHQQQRLDNRRHDQTDDRPDDHEHPHLDNHHYRPSSTYN
ncbi:hypothetical protein BGZ94_007724 [Podila epigama]|nr:hypothetical protein BGZ94_007724 [Podila epigama]